MTEALISGYIDNELDLVEKIDFVEIVHRDAAYKRTTVDLLNQERELRGEPVSHVPSVAVATVSKRTPFAWFGRMLLGLGTATAVFLIWMTVSSNRVEELAQPSLTKTHRFVIYKPDIERAEISGSFTGWHPLPMQRIGDTGYWEVQLELDGGEHRFTYILDGNRRITDPTVLVRERDDFGGENSILSVSL